MELWPTHLSDHVPRGISESNDRSNGVQFIYLSVYLSFISKAAIGQAEYDLSVYLLLFIIYFESNHRSNGVPARPHTCAGHAVGDADAEPSAMPMWSAAWRKGR